jgi:hypothetical protein
MGLAELKRTSNSDSKLLTLQVGGCAVDTKHPLNQRIQIALTGRIYVLIIRGCDVL